MLQFLVTIIDNELLEPVDWQIFEAVNIQYAQDASFSVLLDLGRARHARGYLSESKKTTTFDVGEAGMKKKNLDSLVNAVNDPGEKAIIKGFAQSVASSCGLGCTQVSHDEVILRVLVSPGSEGSLKSDVRPMAAIHHLVHI